MRRPTRATTGSITFTGPVDLAVNTTVDSDKDDDSTDGDITFSSTVNGAKSFDRWMPAAAMWTFRVLWVAPPR